jgi:mono/diheme cytochrome c family protein
VGGLLVSKYWIKTTEQVVEPNSQAPAADAHLVAGQQLYENHCAACHGDNGDGNGPAARFLYPKPRNFRASRFRVVTSNNYQPTDEDLFGVITRGMPGSAMFSFGHLSEAERRDLVGYVRQLRRAGMIDSFRVSEGQDPSADDLAFIDEALRPSNVLEPPTDLPRFDPESVARGKLLFKSEGCITCHGETGKGDGSAQDQRDDLGMPIRPRDLTRGLFKGGHQPGDLYARLVLGMPGTGMPAFTQYTNTQIGDLINYSLSLSDPDTRARAEHKRRTVLVQRVSDLGTRPLSEEAWSNVPSAKLIVSPLWWRDHADPDLQVAAIHDGKSIAIRLTWLDMSQNDSVRRPEDFEDMAAVQLYKGRPEPFVGMGALPSKAGSGPGVDLWLWRAAWNRNVASADNILDDYPLDMPHYRDVNKGKDFLPPDFLTARAAGNLISDPAKTQAGSNMAAQGFGSVTFRPRTSQFVTADATCKDGRWTVVLRRPLEVGPDDGVPLAPGDVCSIAFALWDGAANDRNGQKLVTIWHDLKIE